MLILQTLKNSEQTLYFGVKELARAAEQILAASGRKQEKGTVTKFPNERTVRYYITEGLMPAPIEKRGQALVFGYEHLLTLLVIKKLQADGLPISVIKTLINGRSIEELEQLLGEEVHVFTESSALDEYREATGHTDDSDVVVIEDSEGRREYLETTPGDNRAKKYLESLLMARSPEPARHADSGAAFSRPPVASPKPASENWKRYEIAPGLELHIGRNYRSPLNDRERQEILQLIDQILQSRNRK